ncbi:MAG: Ig-like domain-containing protein [Clostridiales bacterium]|nr:Ig-like domain-containing protein [Clostridiales bacterium]
MNRRRMMAFAAFSLSFIFLTFSLFFSKVNASAAMVTDTLSFYVGYFGGPYYEKATFNWKELYDNLNLQEEAYTYTNGERVAVQGARGFYLRDLFDYADIDTSSIASMDFYTADQKAGAFASFTKEALFDTPRYYFGDLAYKMKYDGNSLWEESNEVEPMLAIEDNWSWFNPGTENTSPNFSSMSTSNRFRLCFGQAYPEEAATNKSAKMVHTVYVTFFGSPEISARKQDLELKVGSDYTLKLDIDAADELIGNEIRKGIVWQSDDNNIASVDDSGKLTLINEGTVQIIAISGDMKAVYNITVTADTDTETATKTSTDFVPNNLSNGNGYTESSANDAVSNGTSPANTENKNNSENSDTENSIFDSLQNETRDQTDTEEEASAESIDVKTKPVKITEVISADKLIYKLDSGVMEKSLSAKRKVSPSKDDSITAFEIPPEKNNYLPVTVILISVFFALGFLWGLIRFKREI